MLLVLPRMQHSTHYLMSNLPPGREWKDVSHYLLWLTREQRWLTVRWLAPSVVWCNAECVCVSCYLFTTLQRLDSKIAVPGNISQYRGIQSGVVWHFSTACWPAVSGVAEPCYLLPAVGPNINHTSSIKKIKNHSGTETFLKLSMLSKNNSCSNTLEWWKNLKMSITVH